MNERITYDRVIKRYIPDLDEWELKLQDGSAIYTKVADDETGTLTHTLTDIGNWTLTIVTPLFESDGLSDVIKYTFDATEIIVPREQMLEQIVYRCVSLTDIMREFPCCDYERLYNEINKTYRK